jgi:uncharacterized protein (TIGR02453 family)
MSGFQGFADRDATFFKSLAKHNDREWFQAHKPEFERGWNTPMKLLMSEVRESIDEAYRGLGLDEPRLFRIYRDVRFARDKSPYKTELSGMIALRSGKSEAADLPTALFFQVGAERTFAAAGHYMMEKDSLERFRRAVADDKRGRELEKLLAKLDKAGFRADSHEPYKRVPSGYAADHPRAELLKRKGLTVSFPALPKALLTSPKLVKWLSDACEKSLPLIAWLTRSVR